MSWSKVEKSTGTNTAVDKRDKGHLRSGWFGDWLSGILWKNQGNVKREQEEDD